MTRSLYVVVHLTVADDADDMAVADYILARSSRTPRSDS